MDKTSETPAGVMPIGQRMSLPIRGNEVETTPGDVKAPQFTEDAVATLVWENYNIARNYVENNEWLLEWLETDILNQSPIPNRSTKVEAGRPPRVPRFLVAKQSRVLARAVKRALFAEQYPFFLRPVGKMTQDQVNAWTALIGILLKRMKFSYFAGLMINCQVLQGTCIGKVGWLERTVTKKFRKRIGTPATADMPSGAKQEIPTKEGDAFAIKSETVTESWPFFEYRRLGTTLFDPKWCTPDAPDESAGYVIDVDYVNFEDLARMRNMACYKNIPSEETLKTYFFHKQEGTAPTGSQIEESMTTSGSMVAHAEGRNRSTDKSPLHQSLMIIEQWDKRTVKTILEYDGRKLTIRDEEHDADFSFHVTATWYPIDNCGYGMGVGRLVGPDQRINQGVINESLKMLAYPFNAPLVYTRGENAPTQNVINRMGGFWPVDTPPGGDVRKAVGFLDMPKIPEEAWKMLDLSQRGSEELSGANSAFQQGNLPGPGSSAARTATGANRIAGMSDQGVADPVESFACGVIVPVIQFLVNMVKLKMPLEEIRAILSAKHAAVIETNIAMDSFVTAEFEVDVLAGQKLAAKAGIQQLIPFFLQIVQQPQLLEYLHQRGETVDFKVIMDLLLQVSELTQQPDVFRPLSPRERAMLKQMNPGMQKLQGSLAVEKLKGQNKKEEIGTKGQVDLATKAAETVMAHTADGIPLERAAGLVERSEDVQALKNGLPDFTQ